MKLLNLVLVNQIFLENLKQIQPLTKKHRNFLPLMFLNASITYMNLILNTYQKKIVISKIVQLKILKIF